MNQVASNKIGDSIDRFNEITNLLLLNPFLIGKKKQIMQLIRIFVDFCLIMAFQNYATVLMLSF
jgi:hypothetical protein